MREGKSEGKWKFYHFNGELMSEGIMKNDYQDGLWKSCDEDGQFKHELTYKDGEVLSCKGKDC